MVPGRRRPLILVLGLLLAAGVALRALPARADTPGIGVTVDDAGGDPAGR
ncbi:MAG: hypothetical protein R2854_05935 [Caldilineaceae bacterium]